jgi:methyltransferase
VSVHAAWLIALWALGRDQDVNLLLLALFVLLQAMRVWILATLGSRWTTRIIVLRGEPLITSGPYRYLSHPNYAVVAAEIAVLPLALHLPEVAIVFTLLNAAVLAVRIRAEARALSASGGGLSRANP